METNKKRNIIPLGVTIGGVNFQAPVMRGGLTTVEGVLDFIVFLLNWAIGFAVIVAIIMIIYSGYMYITSVGDPEKVQKGSGALTAAVVGLLIVFLARTIVVFLLDNILK